MFSMRNIAQRKKCIHGIIEFRITTKILSQGSDASEDSEGLHRKDEEARELRDTLYIYINKKMNTCMYIYSDIYSKYRITIYTQQWSRYVIEALFDGNRALFLNRDGKEPPRVSVSNYFRCFKFWMCMCLFPSPFPFKTIFQIHFSQILCYHLHSLLDKPLFISYLILKYK